jgi:hypothetical protein
MATVENALKTNYIGVASSAVIFIRCFLKFAKIFRTLLGRTRSMAMALAYFFPLEAIKYDKIDSELRKICR